MPKLYGWNPSTSLDGSTSFKIFSSSICFGNGSWTINPSISESLFNLLILAISLSSDISSSNLISVESKPIYSQDLTLLPT